MTKSSSRAYVLLSGGIDSTTCLYEALNEHDEVFALGVNYGQRHIREANAAGLIAAFRGVPFDTLDLRNLIPRTMLTDPEVAIPNASYADLTGVSPTYVPFRNGLMLAAATAYAQGAWKKKYDARIAEAGLEHVDPDEWTIYFGAHKDDAAGDAYPDCTPEFIGSMTAAIHRGTYGAIRLVAPLLYMKKWQVVSLGDALGVPFQHTWSCYAGGEKHCGTCPTCRARKEAFAEAGIPDPTDYVE
jgi:7-cyano-7-deazaguanine synthase